MLTCAAKKDRLLGLFLLACVALVKLYLILPFTIIVHNAGHDDVLYVTLANSISQGEWLGPYNTLTLAKVPGYPFWLATEHLLGLPPLMAEHLIYFTAVSILYFALVKAGLNPVAVAIALAIFDVSPELFSIESMRLTRNLLYDALTLLLISLLILSMQVKRGRNAIVITAAYSVVLAAYYLVREEFIWIMPAHIVGTVCFFYLRRSIFRKSAISLTMALAFLPLLTVLIVDTAIKGINDHSYGVSILYTQRDGNFPRAMGALQRIKTHPYRKYVPISAEKRMLAYAVSPSFAELRFQLEEGWVNRRKKPASCIEAHICDDYAAQRVFWDIMDAAAREHRSDTAAQAEAFYGAIASEINTACVMGSIACTRPHDSLWPIFQRAMLPDFIHALHAAFGELFNPSFLIDLNRKPWWTAADMKMLPGYNELFELKNIYTDADFTAKKFPRLAWVSWIGWGWPCIITITLGGVFPGLAWQIQRARWKTEGGLREKAIACSVAVVLTALVCRFLLLAVVTTTNFRAFGGYMSPVYGLTSMLFAILMSCLLDYLLGRFRWQSR
jgi:hypothetical protein